MKTLFTIFKIVFFLLLTGTGTVSAQDYFRVIGGIPHLPTVDPSSVIFPVSGMLICSNPDKQPLIYNGLSWETLCSGNINSATVKGYLEVENKIPFLPSLNADPIGIIEVGAVYLSKTQNAMMIYDGNAWGSVAEIVGNGNFTQYGGFSTDSGLKVSKLPVLDMDPNPFGLSMGAIYINTVSKAIRYYDGTKWTDIDCLPIISTVVPTNITNVSARSGVNIINNGGTPVSTQGICWSTNANPDVTLNTKTSYSIFGTDIGLFPSVISGLQADTDYHVRAYAINGSGIVYGEDVLFRTAIADTPSIITMPIDDSVSFISANSGGIIDNDGGAPVSLRGITWSAVGDPMGDSEAITTSDGSGVGSFPSEVTNLLRNTTYYVRAYAVNIAGKAYGNLLEFTTDPATVPVLSSPNIKITDITDTSAVSEVTILNNGGETVTERGMSWSTDRVNIVYGPSTTVNPTDIGTFVCNITNLESGKIYYVRGYARNSLGTSYSSESSFIATSLPTLTTTLPYNYDAPSHKDGWFPGYNGTQATSGGNISSNGVSLITKRGLCWNTDPDPTTASTTKTEINVSGSGTGIFKNVLTSLSPNTTYYVKAYAVNSMGTGYGNELSFKTPQLPELTTTAASLITNTTISSGGNITTDGRMPVTARGLCWGLTNNLSIGGEHTTDGNGITSFISNLTKLRGGTQYYIRAYATNAIGTGYGITELVTTDPPVKATITTKGISKTPGSTAAGGGDITSDGGAEVSSRGLIWSLIAGFTPDYLSSPNKTEHAGGSGKFDSTITGLLPNKTYYVVAYAVNGAGVAYGDEINFKTYTLPSLITTGASSMSATTAVSGGDIFSDGGDIVTNSGLVWDTSINPTTELSTKTTSGTGIGNFIHTLNGLMGSTTYYVRAYAGNKAGTAYGDEKSFTTALPILPVINTAEAKNIKENTATGGGLLISNGGGLISQCGLVWSTVPEFTPSLATSQKTIQQYDKDNFSSDISGLSPGITYYVRAYAVNPAGVQFGNVVAFKTTMPATLTTLKPIVASITSTSATSGGNITNNGGSYISRNGICWSTANNPTISDNISKVGSGSGNFTANLTDLMGSTTYYVRAYATNLTGTAYGNLESFETMPPLFAIVVTTNAKNITGDTATSGGDIISNGGALVASRGVVWSTDPNFDPDTVFTNKTADTGYEKGIFDSSLENLTPGTTYYVCAYVVTVAGTSYGNKISFTTPVKATITSNQPGSITSTTAVMGGTISYSGGSAVLKRGVLWSTVDGFVPDILSADRTDDGTGTGIFNSNLKNLTPSTMYYVRAYATNVVGTSFGEQLSFTTQPPTKPTLTTVLPTDITGTTANSGGNITDEGGLTVDARGVIWSIQPNFDPATETVNKTTEAGDGLGIFNSTITGLNLSTTYYVCAYASNAVGITYGNKRSFTTTEISTTPVKAIIATNPPGSVTSTTAVMGGTISDSGGAIVLNRGVLWSTVDGFIPDFFSANITNDGTGTGSFNSNLKSLTPNTTYYARAYVTNIAGTSFGAQLSFTTQPPAKPTLTTVLPTGITGTTANAGGNITDEGGLTLDTCGLIWSIDPNFDPVAVTPNKTTQPGGGLGIFNSTITGLNLGTIYYVCAYASNGVGTNYGNKLSFITPKMATIASNPPGSVTNTTAVMGGTISNSGGSAVLKRGVLWSTVGGFVPDISSANITADGTGTGSFNSNLKNLTPSTIYYVRAYATTDVGTSFGAQVSFTTFPPTTPTLTTVLPTNINGTTANGGGNITDDGGITVGTCGLIWSISPNFNPAAVTPNKTTQAANGKGVFNSMITGLNLNTTYYVRAYASNGVGTNYGNELSFTTLDSPTLTTIDISAIAGTTAASGGVIISDGGAPVTAKGVCWSTSPNPMVGFLTKTVDTGTGTFVSNLNNLEPATRYYVRAYATNSIGTSYGNEIDFITNPILASLTTTDPVITSNTTASSGGTISFDGGAPITARGIVWSTDENFVPEEVILNRTTDGSGIGNFISELTDLVKSTTYYVRAYATNSAGTAYGDQFSVVIYATSPLLITNVVSSITATTATGGGEITNDGGAAVTQRGICWSSTLLNPTIALDTKTSDADLGGGSFTSQMGDLLPNTLYYVRAYAINGIGVAYGLSKLFITLAKPTLTATTPATNIRATTATSGGWITDDGRSPILSRGIVWDIYSNPTIALDSKTVGNATQGTGSFSADITGLTPNTTYYVRAYATNSVGITYGSEAVFTTNEVMIPVLNTTAVTAITEYAANGEGEVIDDGGMPVTARGFVWDTNNLPDIALPTKIVNGTAGNGSFNNVLPGLIPGFTYFVRAYATNSKGTAYGNEVSLTLSAVAPVLGSVTISNIQMVNADGAASLTFDGGTPITDLGLIWNATATIPAATASNSLSVGAVGTSISGTISGLSPATEYYVWAYATNQIGTGYSTSAAIFTSADLAMLTTTVPTAILQNTATGGGTISSDGGVPVTARGVCWSTAINPTVDLPTKTSNGTGIGSFTSSLTGLTQGTQYYVRAYATNTMGTAYGAQEIFTTSDYPSVTTADPTTSITSTSATGGGEIISDGGAAVTSRGICWSTTVNPTILLPTKTSDGTGTGPFTSNLSSLTLATTYYIRAYATNSVGTAYGAEVPFTTLAEVPVLDNVVISNMTAASTDGSATVISERGSPVTARGLVWSSVTAAPTLADSIFTDISSGLGNFTGELTGLVNGTTYHVRAYATNSIGTGFSPLTITFTAADLPVLTTTIPNAILQNAASSGGTISSNGGAVITSRGVCWSTTPEPTILNAKTSNGIGTGTFTSSLTGLTQGTQYYVRAYATNDMGTAYGAQQIFTTLELPNVTTTAAVTSITTTSATCGGNILGNGGTAVTSYGICWSTTVDPTILLPTKTTINDAGTGPFTGNLSSLTAATLYHFRAYATNSLGTAYGNDETFTTSAVIPSVSNVTTSNMTATSADGSATVNSDGGAAVTARGLVWSTITGTPTLADNVVTGGLGTGNFAATISGLSEVPIYYVRAYATNSVGTAYSPLVRSFRVCLPLTAVHVAGLNGAPVDKTIAYTTVSSDIAGTGAPQCWITQNLGSDGQATAAGDATEASAGWYWQFNRAQGYKHDGTTRTPTIAWLTSINELSTWIPANDPCGLLLGSGWRLPTQVEWTAADAAPQNWSKDADAYASVLKLHDAGSLAAASGVLGGRGTRGGYWSSNQTDGTRSYFLSMTGTGSSIYYDTKASAYPVRCLRNTFVVSVPKLTDVATSNMTATSAVGSVTVILDGGAAVTARGFVWNTTGAAPTLADNVVTGGHGMGSFTATITGLSQGATIYYLRAYATNSVGTAYSPLVKRFRVCTPLTAVHVAGFNGAPVDKTIAYTTVSSDMTGTVKCWITQNLGSDGQATAVNDATEASAGWYWQFNRAQGYKHDGTTRTPATSWITSNSQSTNWTAANDPCGLLLGGGWRVPTQAEWAAVDNSQNWGNAADAYASVLKLHDAGYLLNTTAALGTTRGTTGAYWSSLISGTSSWYLSILGGNSYMTTINNASALSVRCLQDAVTLSVPTLTDVTTSNMTATSADGFAVIALDGGATVTARGLVWNTTGAPTLADNVVTGGLGTGSFTATISGLSQGATIYYLRAYATNSVGTAYSPLVRSFRVCTPLTAVHVAGFNGAPVDKTIVYTTVSSDMTGKAQCWITQNLGSDGQATAVNDATEASAGWYWQFNRAQGYKHDGTTRTPATSWITSNSQSTNWTAANDPCGLLLGGGWRVPTQAEWTAVDNSQNWGNAADAYVSVLKLHDAGYLLNTTAALGTTRGTIGAYWSSLLSSTISWYLSISGGNSYMTTIDNASALSVRCLQDAVALSVPTLTDVTTSNMTATSADGSAVIALDGGATVTARGLVWNTTGAPTLADNVVTGGLGTGSFTATISGLSQGATIYYIRAYATNSVGTAYSPLVRSFRVCQPLTAVHVAGLNGAPVDRTIVYATVSSDMTGTAQCWITQNLGSDGQATAVNDATEASAGWYWQFNRAQGYKHDGTTRTPATSWITSNSQSTNWTEANDPCGLLLGGGWRLPTHAEWTAVDNSQNWGNAADAYASVLKLHDAGYLLNTTATLGTTRGTFGAYWSSLRSSTNSWYLSISGGNSFVTTIDNASALPVRCLR